MKKAGEAQQEILVFTNKSRKEKVMQSFLKFLEDQTLNT